MKTRVLSELFILSLCVLVSFSAKSKPNKPANSGGQGDSDVQRRQQPQFQQPPVQPSSAARRAEQTSRISDPWPSSGDDDLDQQQSGDEDINTDDDYEDNEEDEDGDSNYDDGDNNNNEDEDDAASSGDEVPVDVPQVTRGPLPTRCQNMSSARVPYPEAYRPQCTDDGAFMPMQCHHGTGECWCVDADGKVYGNVYRKPDRPTCSRDRAPWTPAPVERSTPADDIVIVDGSPSVQTPDVRRPGDDDRENPGVEPVPPRTWYEYILHHPLLLTAVIAGSVLFLVIVVLMLMFCVYRMRKKDEGSYSLDEPRQTFNYTRAKDQEFFA